MLPRITVAPIQFFWRSQCGKNKRRWRNLLFVTTLNASILLYRVCNITYDLNLFTHKLVIWLTSEQYWFWCVFCGFSSPSYLLPYWLPLLTSWQTFRKRLILVVLPGFTPSSCDRCGLVWIHINKNINSKQILSIRGVVKQTTVSMCMVNIF